MFSAFQTFGKLGALASSVARAWSPLSLWPDGIASPGMWISPSTLPASFNDYTGTTPVATPGTVADSANPVGLALDIRAGAPDVLGPELVVNGDFSAGITDWSAYGSGAVLTWDGTNHRAILTPSTYDQGITQVVSIPTGEAHYQIKVTVTNGSTEPRYYNINFYSSDAMWPWAVPAGATQEISFIKFAYTSTTLIIRNAAVFTPTPGEYHAYDNISVREVPGNHMLQSTSAARPLMSARVNLLQYTEDFTNGYWTKTACTAPTAMSIVEDTTNTNHRVQGGSQSVVVGATYSFSVRVKRLIGARNIALIGVNAPAFFIQPFVLSGAGSLGVASEYGGASTVSDASVVLGADGFYTCSLSVSWSSGTSMTLMFDLNADDAGSAYLGDGVSSLEFDGIQWQSGPATPYQSVPGDGSTYATDFPIFQKYDGVDDGMATASFAAGTLINGMDCMIPVRRDSGANCVAGLYNGIADATKFFGMAESGSGSGCVGSGAGTPTVWVDNTQLTGGTAVTRGTLHTALTAGSYHILEFRNLDLSAWTATGFGLYTSYVFPGARGDIMLFESTASTEDKDKARQYLADKYGVTLA